VSAAVACSLRCRRRRPTSSRPGRATGVDGGLDGLVVGVDRPELAAAERATVLADDDRESVGLKARR
jgi:hypothetical protein